MRYFSGKLVAQLPENAGSEPAQLALSDLAGRQLFVEKLPAGASGLHESIVGDLPPAVDIVRLNTASALYTGKISAF